MSDLRVYIRPIFAGLDNGEGGIRRWVEAQHRYLSDYGIVPVGSEDKADVVVCHAGDIVDTAKPLVVHNHGLYATLEQKWDRWAWLLNQHVIELLRRSDIATVPSRWVAEQVARGMSITARVLYAGVDPELWEPGVNGNYVLWNKTRVDPVCDPAPLTRLAIANPQVRFLTTYGDNLPNVQRTGKLPYDEARGIIRNAGVYLSTTRETFGIGTVEAMASGVPVLGWAFGGNLDIVKHLETGYLAKPGDYDDLQNGLEWLIANRDEIGVAAREDVLSRFTWRRAVAECAEMYREAAILGEPRPRVSVIVTCYKLEEYLGDCLASLQAQTMRDWECMVVDDCSPVTEERNCRDLVTEYTESDSRIQYLRTPRNLYLAGARNFGIEHSRGRYIISLDADDMLNPRALEVLSDFLDKQPGYAIAYGAFELIEPNGHRWISRWPQQFRWEHQMSHRNQLPYAAMCRRGVWERTGGYRERCQTAEDADFWCRVTSYGARAYKATDYPTLLYRNRPDSMSHTEREPDWTLWYPWSRNKDVTPFGSVGEPPNKMSWPVSLYTDPLISVVIPVGPGHENVVRDALDSVAAQSMPHWECIVVNDTGKELGLAGFPWAQVLSTPAPGSGPAVARNVGIGAARADLFCLLDADDWLMPTYLQRCMETQKAVGGYVYTDWFKIDKDGSSEAHQTPEYSAEGLAYDGFYHAITGVFPKEAWQTVGGFDFTVSGWEDWDFVFALATKGYCGTRVAEPLFCYRFWSGQRRENDAKQAKRNATAMRKKWKKWLTKEALMGCGSCGRGGGRRSVPTPAIKSTRQATIEQVTESGMVLLEYVGNAAGTRTYRGARSGQLYRFGANSGHQRRYVYAVDAPALTMLSDLRLVEPKAEQVIDIPTEPLVVRQADSRIATG